MFAEMPPQSCLAIGDWNFTPRRLSCFSRPWASRVENMMAVSSPMAARSALRSDARLYIALRGVNGISAVPPGPRRYAANSSPPSFFIPSAFWKNAPERFEFLEEIVTKPRPVSPARFVLFLRSDVMKRPLPSGSYTVAIEYPSASDHVSTFTPFRRSEATVASKLSVLKPTPVVTPTFFFPSLAENPHALGVQRFRTASLPPLRTASSMYPHPAIPPTTFNTSFL